MVRQKRKVSKNEVVIKEKGLLQKATELNVDYNNKLKLVEEKIKELKGQIIQLETKKVGLQGAIIALSHMLDKESIDGR